MGRRKEGGFEILVSMPWQAGAIAGVIAYFGIRHGIGAFLRSAGGPLFSGLNSAAESALFAPLAWMGLGVCWLAAVFSYFERRRRSRLLDIQTGLGSIAAMSWRQFEMLVGEAFRRQGYAVEETGLGGADGGIDLLLRKNGRTELVQCKQWRAQQVNVSVVREMWGLVAHHGAAGAKIVCVGTFTKDAAAFAAGKSIELITGEALLALVKDVQSSPERQTAAPADRTTMRTEPAPSPSCPHCGKGMVARNNKTTRDPFWGCSSYPRCRGTLPV